MIDILGTAKKVGLKAITKVKKVSPTLLLAGGTVVVLAGVVYACKKTPKAEKILEENGKTADIIKNTEIGTEVTDEDGSVVLYTKKDKTCDICKLAFNTGKDLAKVYAVPAGMILGGFGMIFAGFGILNKRNTQLIAACSAISKAFEDYKDKVKEKLGKENEKDIRFNAEEHEKETVEETKDGKKRAKKNRWKSYSDFVNDPYARCFDEMNPYFKRDNQANKDFLLRGQSWANDLLRAQGHCFLNEVYDILGFERTAAGAVTGWVLGNGGDDFIDFGIDDGVLEANRAFMRGEEPAIWLDFNVDGVILDYI